MSFDHETRIRNLEDTKFTQGQIVQVASFEKADLPNTAPAFRIIGVSDEAGGAVLAFSDGTEWRRVTDRAIVS